MQHSDKVPRLFVKNTVKMEFICYYGEDGRDGVTWWFYMPESTEHKFDGLHSPGKTNDDVKRVKFQGHVRGHYDDYWDERDGRYLQSDHHNLKKFPRGITQIFPRLESLDFIRCGLTSIEREDLIGLENLSSLNLSYNELESLPSDLFKGMKNLKTISFVGNKLKYLSSNLLQPIKDNGLKLVDFSKNGKFPHSYSPGEHTRFNSLQKLMDAIDKNFQTFVEEEEKEVYGPVFEELWATKMYSDFTIIGGDGEVKEFLVHKNILGPQSSVLAAVFETDLKESKTGTMTIDGFSADTVEGMLQFLYTGQLKDEGNAMSLYEIAGKYDVKKLKTKTENAIMRSIDASNAIKVFEISHDYKSEKLKIAAFNEIKKMFPEMELNDSLMDRPEDLKQMVQIKKELQMKLEAYNKG